MYNQRGPITALIDRLVARQLGFPPETSSYTVTSVRIPIDDYANSIELAADLYQPVLPPNTQPAGTILIRGPYGRGFAYTFSTARPYAARGYQCLFVSCRGTFASTGTFDPWRDEEEDGHAVVEWMRTQPWYTGSFATLGASYSGFTQWALMRRPPPDMVAAVIQCAPHDFSKALWGNGTFATEWITWSESLVHQEETGILATLSKLSTQIRLRAVINAIPMLESVTAHFKHNAPWLQIWLTHPDLSHSYYASMQFNDALERAKIPIFLASGWSDLFASQTLQQYARLSTHNAHVALLMGPWNHMQMGLSSLVHQRSFEWVERHLGGKQRQGDRGGAVQYFATGARQWRDALVWPPPSTSSMLDVQPGGFLASHVPSGREVLGIFITTPLSLPLEIAGRPVISFSHAATTQADVLFLQLSEVDANGRSHAVCEAYKRLDPNVGRAVEVQLGDCAHVFQKGRSVGVVVAGARSERIQQLRVVVPVVG